MTLVERLKQLLGNDSDIEIDDDVDIEEVIKNKVKSSAANPEGSGESAGADELKKSEGSDTDGLSDNPNKNDSGGPGSKEVKETKASEEEVVASETDKTDEEVKEDSTKAEGDPGDSGPDGSGVDQGGGNGESVAQNSTIFEDGWFDEVGGIVDTSKIKDDSVKNAFDMVLKWYADQKRSGLIDRAVDDELKTNYLLNVKPERLKSMLDLTNITVEGDTVSGVKEAIETLKTEEPGLFRDKAKESNPLNEGFNPVERRDPNPRSFMEAARFQNETF